MAGSWSDIFRCLLMQEGYTVVVYGAKLFPRLVRSGFEPQPSPTCDSKLEVDGDVEISKIHPQERITSQLFFLLDSSNLLHRNRLCQLRASGVHIGLSHGTLTDLIDRDDSHIDGRELVDRCWASGITPSGSDLKKNLSPSCLSYAS